MNRDELNDLWRLEDRQPTQQEISMIVEKIESKTQKLDRKILSREVRECVAAAISAAMFGAGAVIAPPGLMKWGMIWIAISSIWIIFHLLRYGKGPQSPLPTSDFQAYRKAVAAKYDHQIRLLKNVKYWYLLPPYVGMVMLYAGAAQRTGGMHGKVGWMLGLTTSVVAAIWWLNEVWAVRKLRQERDELADLLSGPEV